MNKLIVFLALLTVMLFVYTQGLKDGEQRYKQSHRMYMTLKSAYTFGYEDCRARRAEDWDGK
jgi:hypothetical protein